VAVGATGIEIRQANSETEEAYAAELMAAYLAWGAQQLRERYGLAEAPADPGKVRAGLHQYRNHLNCLLVAYAEGRPVGIGALRQLPDGAAEIKRMYVVPEARSLGVGSALLDSLLEAATARGADVVRLDTAGFMTAAHSLYRSRGFTERPPYEGSEIPATLHEHWLFFERPLASADVNVAR
jgi:ribosomal protein S18 acetylase RimI-like enzyme